LPSATAAESRQELPPALEPEQRAAPAEVPKPPAPLPGSVEALAYRPASPRSIEQAVLEVKRVVDALQCALTDMEEVLELIEDAEQQKVADERELAKLQDLVRQRTQVRERIPTSQPAERRRREAPEAQPSQAPHPSPPSQAHGPSAEERQGRRRRRGRG